MTKEKMINVEGDYNEIVKWMNAHPVSGVRFSMNHGIEVYGEDENGEAVCDHLNCGLFSLEEEHSQNEESCSTCYSDYYHTNFSVDSVMFNGYEMKIEDPENTNKIRF